MNQHNPCSDLFEATSRIVVSALLVSLCAFGSSCFGFSDEERAVGVTAGAISVCGNSVIESLESCDDGGTASGNGCSSSCQVENTYFCSGVGASTSCSVQCAGGTSKMAYDVTTGKSYFYCSVLRDYATAKSLCAGLQNGNKGWKLVRIDNAAENTLVTTLITARAWIGATDFDDDGIWRWADGDKFWKGSDTGIPVGGLYNNWVPSVAPDNASNEDCAAINATTGTWDDRSCFDLDATTNAYVCEGRLPSCGISGVNAGEECDDMNTSSADGCDTSCYVSDRYVCLGSPSSCQIRCPQNGSAPTNGTQVWFNGKSYFYCETSGSTYGVWSSAATRCNDIGNGWRLVRIESPEENDMVNALATDDVWLGGADNVEGVWRWQDNDQFWQGDDAGSAVAGFYEDWGSSRPNISVTSNCLMMDEGSDNWQDLSCTSLHQQFCEGPEPTCGDSVVQVSEECDQGNTTNGDGCDNACHIEKNYVCTGSPSACVPAPCTTLNGGQVRDPLTSKEYYYCNAASDWTSAKTACENIDGAATQWTLADPSTVGETNFLVSVIIGSTWIAPNCTYLTDPGGTQIAAACSTNLQRICEGPVSKICGDGIIAAGETCDDQNGTSGDGCSSLCVVESGYSCTDTPSDCNPICGNGALHGSEACDDGDMSSGDGCSSSCTIETGYSCSGAPSVCNGTCGDGVVAVGEEQCDDMNAVNTDACVSCQNARCGDEYRRTGVETCDDGNMNSTDGCSSACAVEAGYTCTTAKPNVCDATLCGDGIRAVGEEDCDDANMITTDACIACVNARCGDAFVRSGFEACDDGNTSNNDNCLNTCVVAICRDGFVYNGVEECDDNNSSNTDACLNTCDDATCGDNFVQAGVEDCDDANGVDSDACRNNCDNAACGDGVVRIGVENCDDGNLTIGDGCSTLCTIETGYYCPGSPQSVCTSMCGDGIKASDEECDDEDTMSGDGCNSLCDEETGFNCTGSPSTCTSTCGDGVRAMGPEQCDDGDVNDNDSCLMNCMNATCGDGQKWNTDGGTESCDFGDTVDGDGCSSRCLIEDTGTCTTNAQCDLGACDMNLQVCNATDNDGDGVPNVIEMQEGTDPFSLYSALDTDGDGHPDFIEDLAGSNKNARSSKPTDSDNDHVPDLVEERQGTDPTYPAGKTDFQDSDDDGVADYAERGARSLGAGCSTSTHDASAHPSLALALFALFMFRLNYRRKCAF